MRLKWHGKQLQSQVKAAGVHSKVDKLRAAVEDMMSSAQDERSRMEEWISHLKEGL